MPSFDRRSMAGEQMDDFSIADARLTRALDELRLVNRFLGGYAATLATLMPFLRRRGARPTRLLDVGTGVADIPEEIVRRASRRLPGLPLEIVAVDANEATVAHARRRLDERMPARLRPRVRVEAADALALPYPDGSFDLAITSLFLHHFREPQAVRVLAEMARVSGGRVLVNDLHRHPLAYHGIRLLTAVLRASPMVRHDGPVSVLRGFRRPELLDLAARAGLPDARVRWRWAFRFLLTSGLPEVGA